MAALLAVVTFVAFIALDYLIGFGAVTPSHERRRRVREPEPAWIPSSPSEPVWIAGYQLPEPLVYHPGHTWAKPVGDDTVVMGIDDFARRLIGSAERISVPSIGAWLRQGSKAFRVSIDGRSADFVSPVEGEVVEVNSALAERPAMATEEPYGRGWVLKVRSADLARNLKNLLSGSTARKWMEDSRERLDHQVMALSGSVLMDGGEPISGFARHLPEEDWKRLVEEFLLN